ncbi:hypothetical protein I316_02700 [Kwoniella heveanensis BCC8398]|uniref:PIN domain-containing protein n=1 Tax=Kwoniella heveanensis BCC8398 TaxID=1296120 RepID=A0A1B9GXH7_9TREE|nr:hypothetical protein I316_02700 [Kwoniella heveanensis BCC8398]
MMPKLRESFNVDELVHTAREMTPQRSQYFLLKDGAPLYRRLEPLPPHVVVLSLHNNAVPNIPLTQPVPLAAMNRMREGTTTHAYPSGLLLYLDSNILLQDAQISARMIEAMAQLEAKAIILPQVVAEMRSSNAKRKLRSFIGSQTTMVASEDLQMKRSGVDMKGDPALLTGDEMIRSEAFAHAKRSARPGLLLTRDISMGHILRGLRPDVGGQPVMEVILHPRSRYGVPETREQWRDVLEKAGRELRCIVEEEERDRENDTRREG